MKDLKCRACWFMNRSRIVERKGTSGEISYQLKYEAGKNPVTGKRQTRYKTIHGTKKDALKELRRLLSQIDEGTHVDPNKCTLAEWVINWSEIIKPMVSAKTFERYLELLQLHVLPVIGNLTLQKLNGTHIESMYSKLRLDGYRKIKRNNSSRLSERTILHVHRVLSQCLTEAVRKRVLSRNPIEDVRAPRPNAERASVNSDVSEIICALDQEKLNTLLNGFKSHSLYPIVTMATATGMRRGEILGLRWSDIDYERGVVRIERSVEESKIGGLRFKAPKNKSSKRTIGIDQGLMGLLRKHWQKQLEDSMKLGPRLRSDALIFPLSPMEPHSPYPPGNVTKQFGARSKKIGFPNIRFHDLRHTHATLLLSAGVPINAVSQRLGHSTPMITLTVYGHVLKRSEEMAVSVSASMLGKTLEEV